MGYVRWIVETAEHRVLATGYRHPGVGEPEPGMLLESLPDGPWRVVFIDAPDLSDDASNVLTVEAIDDHLS